MSVDSQAGSFLNKNVANFDQFASSRPRILLMGLQGSGKSSIKNVVFNKMSPNETQYLESTNKINKEQIINNSFVHFEVWEIPGQMQPLNDHVSFRGAFSQCNAVVLVIDAQNGAQEAIANMKTCVQPLQNINPSVKIEVFIHKVDVLSDDHKIELQQELYQHANDSNNFDPDASIRYSFYLTSIYDYSIFEAFSKVIQKLIPELPTLEYLLNVIITRSCIEKAFLFDVVSKIYVATDGTAVDMQTYELCGDIIDVVVDLSYIYTNREQDYEYEPTSNHYDEESSATIKLNNDTIILLREVNPYLALVCIMREENFNCKRGILDYNFLCIRDSLRNMFALKSRQQQQQENSFPANQTNGLGDIEAGIIV